MSADKNKKNKRLDPHLLAQRRLAKSTRPKGLLLGFKEMEILALANLVEDNPGTGGPEFRARERLVARGYLVRVNSWDRPVVTKAGHLMYQFMILTRHIIPKDNREPLEWPLGADIPDHFEG